MAEPMHARIHARRPANRRPRIPHPHLASAREEDSVPVDSPSSLPTLSPPPLLPPDPPAAPDSAGWTPADVPLARSSGRSRRGSERAAPAERLLSFALGLGLLVNLAAVLAARLLPAGVFGGSSYDGDDFLLAAAVLLSGYALLAAGRLSRRRGRDG